MVFSKPLEEIVRQRYSVRTYNNSPLSSDVRAQIEAYFEQLSGPFPGNVIFKIIDSAEAVNGAKLGTYGMVKGASVFIGAGVDRVSSAMLELGYEFEKLILFLTTLELGTVWLGGTFNRGEFAKTMALDDDMLFPAISPVGYFERKRLKETLMRSLVKADERKPWETMFFEGGFEKPLTKAAAGEYEFPLEMVRLGPSASNKQPWRVVKDGQSFHFYEQQTPGYSGRYGFDMQAIDMGIAACHFHMALLEKGIDGSFKLNADPGIAKPANTIYQFTWETV